MKIAVIRVRGTIGVPAKIRKTLELLRLKRKHNLVIVDDTPSIMGMIKKVEGYITYGPINEKTFIKLIKKRAKKSLRKKADLQKIIEKFGSLENFAKAFFEGKIKLRDVGIKEVFCLHPPRKGWERKGIKKFFSQGGALGYRGDKINELIERML